MQCNCAIYLTNKIPFLDVYGDINLVGHVIKSHKALRALWKICVSPYTSKNGCVYLIFLLFPFEANLNFSRSRHQIRLSILACLGDLDNASLSKWRYKKKFNRFLIKSHLLIVKHRDFV